MGESPAAPPDPDILATVHASVEGFDAATAREVASRNIFLAELARLDRPFDRHGDPVHVTGSAIVSGPRGTVLHWHKRLGGWLQPGGHVDAGEAPWEAALRETREETGLSVRHPPGGPRMVHLDVHPAAQGHTHLDLRYLLVADDSDPRPPPGESQEVRWFSLEEAISVADDGLIDGLRRLTSACARCQAGPHPHRSRQAMIRRARSTAWEGEREMCDPPG